MSKDRSIDDRSLDCMKQCKTTGSIDRLYRYKTVDLNKYRTIDRIGSDQFTMGKNSTIDRLIDFRALQYITVL
jgi:hypothetical protein